MATILMQRALYARFSPPDAAASFETSRKALRISEIYIFEILRIHIFLPCIKILSRNRRSDLSLQMRR